MAVGVELGGIQGVEGRENGSKVVLTAKRKDAPHRSPQPPLYLTQQISGWCSLAYPQTRSTTLSKSLWKRPRASTKTRTMDGLGDKAYNTNMYMQTWVVLLNQEWIPAQARGRLSRDNANGVMSFILTQATHWNLGPIGCGWPLGSINDLTK